MSPVAAGPDPRCAPADVLAVSAQTVRATHDQLAVEAPLEIHTGRGDGFAPLAMTMRTPGHDAELAVGFLLGEGWLVRGSDLVAIESGDDVVRLTLAADAPVPAARARQFAITSACGVCGKASRDELAVRSPFPPPDAARPRLTAALVADLPERLRAAQPAFAATGGLHAAGLFDASGTLITAREDVGRHNAVDKVLGARWLAGALPAPEVILVVSGRASFELVQKAVVAGLPALVAIGAPSTAAVELAGAHGLTLCGFARGGRFNVYAGVGRLDLARSGA